MSEGFPKSPKHERINAWQKEIGRVDKLLGKVSNQLQNALDGSKAKHELYQIQQELENYKSELQQAAQEDGVINQMDIALGNIGRQLEGL